MKSIKFLLPVLLSLLLISCDSKTEKQYLIVGTAADNPPYEFMQNGQIVGLDIDFIEAIGVQLGKKVIIKNFDFNGLLAALISENVDVVIAGLTMNQKRKVHVSFSEPYISTNVSILYRAIDNLKNFNDLNNKIIGAQLGTTWGTIAQDLSKKINIKIHALSNNLMLVEELKSKIIDAIILEEVQSKKFIDNNPELASFNLTGFSSEFAIAMSKNSGLIKNVDEAIRVLKNDGTISRITKKWLAQ